MKTLAKSLPVARRIATLEDRVDALETKRHLVEQAERDLLREARQWARVTKLNYCMETRNGSEVRRDVDGELAVLMAGHYRKLMDFYAEELLKTEAS